MSKTKLVFFDFDGVVLDSARIKTEAFPLVFDDYPEHAEAITKYHLEHQGVSRYDKFDWIYENLLNKVITAEESKALGEKFSDICMERILACNEISGSLDLLNYLNDENITCIVASGTPHDELNKIVKLRNLESFFKEVWGSPKKKSEIIEDVLERYNLSAEQCLFLGDATTDYNAARSKSVPFQAVYSNEMEAYWKEHSQKTVADLNEVIENLKKPKINPLYGEEGFSDLRNILIKNVKDGSLTLAISGGSTPLPFYKYMGENPLSHEDIMLNVLWVDERFVPKHDERNNASTAFDAWLQHEYLASVYVMETNDISLKESVNDYKQLLSDVKPDVVLLGMGEDGHIASIFPGQEYEDSVFSCKHPTDGTERISLNYETIAAAKKVILLLSGEKKKSVFLEKKGLPVHKLAGQTELSVFSFE